MHSHLSYKANCTYKSEPIVLTAVALLFAPINIYGLFASMQTIIFLGDREVMKAVGAFLYSLEYLN